MKSIIEDTLKELSSDLEKSIEKYKLNLVKKIKKKVILIGNDFSESKLEGLILDLLEKNPEDNNYVSIFDLDDDHLKMFDDVIIFTKKSGELYFDNLNALKQLNISDKTREYFEKINFTEIV